MIATFACKDTQAVFNRIQVGRWPRDLQQRLLVKLLMLDAAIDLQDLRVPPSNRLERLRGKREGQHSIRVNRQWRVCFKWRHGSAYDVEMLDYH